MASQPEVGSAAADPVRFVLLTTQRTGSTWVRTSLNSHPAIASYGELFLEWGRGFPSGAQFAPLDVEYFESRLRRDADSVGPVSRARCCRAYLDELYRSPRPERAVGFKLMYSQVRRNPALVAYLLASRVRVIHLSRDNLLDVVISGAAAAARGQAHAAAEDSVRAVTVRLDPEATRRRLAGLERRVAVVRVALRASRLPTQEMLYERLRADPSGLSRALDFLGVDPRHGAGLTSGLRKLNERPRSELVANWDELERSLRGTRFAAYLDEPAA